MNIFPKNQLGGVASRILYQSDPQRQARVQQQSRQFKHEFNDTDTPQYDYAQWDASALSTQAAVDLIFSSLESSPNLHTGIIFNAHGSGHHMRNYIKTADKKPFQIAHLVHAIQANRLSVDVLDLSSCMMGTIANTYQLLSQTNIKYLITASNLGMSEFASTLNGVISSKGTFRLVHLLDRTPQEAALNSIQEKVSTRASYTHNSMVINGTIFRKYTAPALLTWMREVSSSQYLISAPSKNQGYDRPSFLAILNQVITNTAGNQRLQQASTQLKQASLQSYVAYKCADAHTHKLYSSIAAIPANSDCIAGVSVDDKALKELSALTNISLPDANSVRKQQAKAFLSKTLKQGKGQRKITY